MVKRYLGGHKGFIGKARRRLLNPQSILVGSLSIGFLTFVSKAFGFLREIVIAYNFGTSPHLDSIILVLQPTHELGLIVSGSIATAMLPIYIEIKKSSGRTYATKYVKLILFFSGGILIIFGLFLLLFPEFFLKIFAPGFEGETLQYSVRKVRILAILPFIEGCINIFSGILKAEKMFFQYAFSQILFNIIAIPIICVTAKRLGEASVLLGWIGGTISVNISLIYFLLKYKFLDFRVDIFNCRFLLKKVIDTLKSAFAFSISNSINVVNNIIDKAFASMLPYGRISSLRYSQVLLSSITAFIIAPLLISTYTEISESKANNQFHLISIRFNKTISDLSFLVIPIVFWLFLFAQDFIKFLFQRGNFTKDSTQLVYPVLVAYSIILTLIPIRGMAINIFYAFRNAKVITFISFTSLFFNALFDWLLLRPYGHVGIAFSTSGVMFIDTLLCLIFLKREYNITLKRKTLNNLRNIFLFYGISFCIFLLFRDYILLYSTYLLLYKIGINIYFFISFFIWNKKNIIAFYQRLISKV